MNFVSKSFIFVANNRLLCIFMPSINLQLFSWKLRGCCFICSPNEQKKRPVDSRENWHQVNFELWNWQQYNNRMLLMSICGGKTLLKDADDAWAGTQFVENVRNVGSMFTWSPEKPSTIVSIVKNSIRPSFVLFRFSHTRSFSSWDRRTTKALQWTGFSYSSNLIHSSLFNVLFDDYDRLFYTTEFTCRVLVNESLYAVSSESKKNVHKFHAMIEIQKEKSVKFKFYDVTLTTLKDCWIPANFSFV